MTTKNEQGTTPVGSSKGYAVMSVNPQPEPDRLETATDQAIAACGGNARDAVKALSMV